MGWVGKFQMGVSDCVIPASLFGIHTCNLKHQYVVGLSTEGCTMFQHFYNIPRGGAMGVGAVS